MDLIVSEIAAQKPMSLLNLATNAISAAIDAGIAGVAAWLRFADRRAIVRRDDADATRRIIETLNATYPPGKSWTGKSPAQIERERALAELDSWLLPDPSSPANPAHDPVTDPLRERAHE